MMYIRGTIDLPLTLSANGTGMLKWYVHGSYGIHPNMRGHSGGGLSMGTWSPISYYTKHKLNTRSSTESEIFGVNNFVPSILWTRNFLNAQDYDVTKNTIFQDKKSAILLEKNGKSSIGNITKHINIQYFLWLLESRKVKSRRTGVWPMTWPDIYLLNQLRDRYLGDFVICSRHRRELPVLHYHKILVIYPYPFFW